MAARTPEPTIELPALVASKPASTYAASELENEVLALFDDLRDPLVRYVCALGASVGDGEDLIQDVFLALFKHLQRNGSRTNLQGWLFRVAHNLALKRRARLRRERDHLDLSPHAAHALPDPQQNPEQRLVEERRRQRLISVVRALPERDRHCMYLRGHGLRYREIAQVLGISLGTVAKSVARAVARLHRADEE